MPLPVPPVMIAETLPFDGGGEDVDHRRAQGPDRDQPLQVEHALGELADRHQRPVDGDRPDGDIDARAVGQARVHHGRRFVDPAADRGDDPVDDAQEMRLVLEMDLRFLELAKALDVAPLVRIDQNVGDGRILQQRLDRAVAGHFGEDLVRRKCRARAG